MNSTILAVKQTNPDGRAKYVSIRGFHHVVASGGLGQVELGIERQKFPRVVMVRSRRRARSEIRRAAANAYHLMRTVRQSCSGGNALRQARRSAGYVPDHPVRYVIDAALRMRLRIMEQH